MTDKRDLRSAINSLRRGRREDRNGGDEAEEGTDDRSGDVGEPESDGVSPESARVSLLGTARLVDSKSGLICVRLCSPSLHHLSPWPVYTYTGQGERW